MKVIADFTLVGDRPVPWTAPEVTRHGTYRKKPKTGLSYDQWKSAVRNAALRAMCVDDAAIGPIKLGLTFFSPTPPGHRHGEIVQPEIEFCTKKLKYVKKGERQADLTNLVKAVEDGLEEAVYANDVQVRQHSTITLYGPDFGVRVVVSAIEPHDYPGAGEIVECPKKNRTRTTRPSSRSADTTSSSRPRKPRKPRQTNVSGPSGR